MSRVYAAGGLNWTRRSRRSPARVIPPQSEADFQASVVNYALLMGWRPFHPHFSMHSTSGFPDLTFVRQSRGVGRLVIAELKSESGVPTDAQRDWLNDLASVPGVEVHLWRPADWPAIREILR